jgi:hypothetical protein
VDSRDTPRVFFKKEIPWVYSISSQKSKSITMVTISSYQLRENAEGKAFVALELTGDIEMIQSSSTGMFYASAKRCFIPSTFSEDIAKSLVGKQIRGRVDRVQTEPYEYTIKETGEVITLAHTYVYTPEESAKVIQLPQASPQLVSA